jgi:crotonobetaine/carnitine-CoA ligase
MTARGLAWQRVPPELRDLDVRELTVPHLLQLQARRYGDRPLLSAGDTRRSYADMAVAVARVAGSLATAGIQSGERVAIMAPNSVDALDLLLGCAWLGAVPVMVNTAARGKPLEHVLRISQARLLVVEDALLPALDVLELDELSLEQVWALGPAHGAAIGSIPVRSAPLDGDELAPAPASPSDVAVIIFTSGTTGPSKGVRCLNGQLFWWGINTGWNLDVGPDDVLATCLPLFHTNAVSAFFQALLFGARFDLGARFSASRFWQRMIEAEATVTYLLGAMVRILADRPPHAHDRGHRVRIALSPGTPADLNASFHERFGVSLLEGYGSSETNHVIGLPPALQRPGWMGRVLPGFEGVVVDDFDEPVPPGEPGELLLRCQEPFSFADGYELMPEKTVEAWRNLWFHTGDRVVQDDDGCLRFVDRITDSIRRRGENISAYEVEEAICGHPAVAAAAVFAVPSELAEDEVMAAIVLRGNIPFDADGLITYLEPRLARYAIPRFIDVIEALPTTENGKVRKAELRARGLTATTWDRERDLDARANPARPRMA